MSSNTTTLLDVLRSRSAVDCDTFDDAVPKALGPFIDCTSNQASVVLAGPPYHELIRLDSNGKQVHAELIKASIDFAKSKSNKYDGVAEAEVAVECMMVKLALRIVPHLTGYSHIQTNPKYSYDTQKTIDNARRIIQIFADLEPSYDCKRVCIKIPSTWEGLQACRALESEGIATLATTMFCMQQAALASQAGCTYIAPYINELRVHFDPGYVDEFKAFDFCGRAQAYYEKIGSKTQVLPASLTSIQEVMMLAGAHHITVSPPLLTKLAETPANPWGGETGAVFAKSSQQPSTDFGHILEDESAWRLSFSRSEGGRSEGKNIQAINIFCEKQEGLEDLVRAA
ncbi:putative Transaldolase [Seiridium cardinale]|uniref:Transaldolase n=1 Tax=Seiridium cardinale TaxID=138064 RepID=A0ABR2X710_9PEZI